MNPADTPEERVAPGIVGVRYLWVEQTPIMHWIGTGFDLRIIAVVLAYGLARRRGEPWMRISWLAVGAAMSVVVAVLLIPMAFELLYRFVNG